MNPTSLLVASFCLVCFAACTSSHEATRPTSSDSAAPSLVEISHQQPNVFAGTQAYAPPAGGECDTARERIEFILKRLYGIRRAQWSIAESLPMQIKCLDELVTWWDRCPNQAKALIPARSELVEERAYLRKMLSHSGVDTDAAG